MVTANASESIRVQLLFPVFALTMHHPAIAGSLGVGALYRTVIGL
jgi:hypothetical protein